jgi:hypothetical protein
MILLCARGREPNITTYVHHRLNIIIHGVRLQRESGEYLDLLLGGGSVHSNFFFNSGSKCTSKIVGNI